MGRIVLFYKQKRQTLAPHFKGIKMNTPKYCDSCIHRKPRQFGYGSGCDRLQKANYHLVSGEKYTVLLNCNKERYSNSIITWLFNKCGKDGKFHKAVDK